MVSKNLHVTITGDADSLERAQANAQRSTRELGDESERTARKLDDLGDRAERSAERTRRAVASTVDAAGAADTIRLLGLLTAGLAAVSATGPGVGAVAAALPALGFTAATGLGATAAALHGVADGVDAYVDAQTEMTRVNGDAVGAQTALNESVAGLSPQARRLAETIATQTRPAIRGIRDDVQAAALPEMREAMQRVLDLQPLLAGGLADTGDELGELSVRAADLVTNPLFRDDLASIMDGNADSIRALGGAGLSFVDVLRTLAASGTPVVVRFSEWLERVAALSDAQIVAARRTGELDRLFAEGEEILGELVETLGQVVVMTLRVSDALGPLGGVVLDVVGEVAELVGQIAQANPLLTQFGAGALIAFTAFLGAGKLIAGATLAVGTATAALGTATAGYSRLGDAMNLIAPTSLRERLDGAASAVDRAGLSAGVATGRLTGSAAAGEHVGRAVQGAGRAALGAAAAFPVAGLTVLALGVAMDALSLSTEDAVEQLLRGGSAAAQAREQIDLQSGAVTRQNGQLVENEGWTRRVNQAVNDWVGTTTGLWASQDSATEAMQRSLDAMTQQERAAVAVTQAEQAYSDAVRDHGPASDEAAAAGRRLGVATAEVERVQGAAERATESHTDALVRQRNEMLGEWGARTNYNQAVLATEAAQRAAAEAVRDHGSASTEGRRATEDQSAAMIQQITAAGELAAAQWAGAGAAVQQAQSQHATTREILALAATATGPAHEALMGMVDDMTATDLRTASVRLSVDDLGRSVLTLPDGRAVVITAPGLAEHLGGLRGLRSELDQLHNRVVKYEINELRTYETVNKGGGRVGLQYQHDGGVLVPMSDGGVLGLAAGGRLTPMRGGVAAVVEPNTWRVIGDRMSGRESYIPHDDSPRSRAILAETADAMGYALVPEGRVVEMAAGSTIGGHARVADTLSSAAIPALRETSTATIELTDVERAQAQVLADVLAGYLDAVDAVDRATATSGEHLRAVDDETAATLRLTTATGTAAPAALLGMTQGLDAATAASSRARDEIDEVTAAALRIPAQRAVSVSAPGAGQTIGELDSTTARALAIPGQRTIGIRADGSYYYGGFADGGVLPGYSPGVDDHRFYSTTGGVLDLAGGESILRPEVTRATGTGWVHGVNHAARVGGVTGALEYLARVGVRPSREGVAGDGSAFADGGVWGQHAIPHRAYASGGVFDWAPDAVDAAIADLTERAADDLARRIAASGGRVVAFARDQMEGKPYGWGTVGPGAFDCSGAASALVNVALRRFPFSRVGATGNFPWSGFRAGPGPGIIIGSFRGSPGHMASQVAGVNIESRGSDGVVVGPRARSPFDPMFDTVAHMPFDTGGDWPSGQPGINLSGEPEHVLTGEMRRAFLDHVRILTYPRPTAASSGALHVSAVLTGPVTMEGVITVDGMDARIRGVIRQDRAESDRARQAAQVAAGVA